MSRELGVEFGTAASACNSLCPGPVDTPLLQDLFASDPKKAERPPRPPPFGRLRAGPRDRQRGTVPRLPYESSYVTSLHLLVDGGISQAYLTPDASDDPQY
jgi:NAD(P)-dependent dehydrogenase (short-subunit alcohol dehydrogenase family)